MTWHAGSPAQGVGTANHKDFSPPKQEKRVEKLTLQAVAYGENPADIELRWSYNGEFSPATRDALVKAVLQGIRAEFRRVSGE